MRRLKLQKKAILTLFVILSIAFINTNQTNAYTVDSFPIPNPSSTACALTDSSDGLMWFIKPNEQKVVKSDGLGNMTEYNIPQINQLEPDSYPSFCSMSSDKSGRILFTSNDRSNPQIARSGYIRSVSSQGYIDSTVVNIPVTTKSQNITPSRIGLFGIEYINSESYWVIGGSIEDRYTIIMKVTQSGTILDYWETEVGEGGVNASVLDNNGNFWVGLRNKLLRISPDGQTDSFNLQNMQNIVSIEVDVNNDIWVSPWPLDYSDSLTPIAKLTQVNSNIVYFSLPEGRTSVPYSLASGPDGSIWFGLMDTGDNILTNLSLNRIDLTGTITDTRLLQNVDAPLSLKMDENRVLWAIVANRYDTDNVSLRLVKISKDPNDTTNPVAVIPTSPKSGNNTIFMVITGFVIALSFTFSHYMHKKHIKSESIFK